MVESTNTYSNKMATIHVLAALIQNPLLFKDNRYNFSEEDFPERFHKILYGAIHNLAMRGMLKIDPIDIDQYLKANLPQYEVFCQNKGVEYIRRAVDLYDKEKFEYYYQALKKYSLINQLNSRGIDTKDIYDPDIIDPKKSEEKQKKFESMSVNDILLEQDKKLVELKDKFGTSSDRVENRAGDGLRELKEKLKERPDMGLPLISPKLTTIFRGQRRGCLFIESAASGSGKSRRGNSEACHLAVPEYYDACEKRWVKTNMHQNVLVISTELEESECQQMWMAFVAGVPENHIKDGRYVDDEESRVDKAITLLEKSNLYFVSITNYDTDDIITIIKKYKQIYDVNYVFFDYLGETLKITSSATRQTRVQGLRTDQVLLMLSSALKDAAKTLGIYIWTASQLSGDYKNAKDLDASYLRSAKSIADKVDAGAILMPIRESDMPIIESYKENESSGGAFGLDPNFVMTVYKVRAGSYQNIKVYCYFDRSTCQLHDLFVTDSNGNLIQIEDTDIEIVLDNTTEQNFASAYAPTTNISEENLEDFDF